MVRRRTARRSPAIASLLATLATLAACDLPTGLPSDAEPFTPPLVFERWWAMTKSCSGLSGDLDAVRWYVVPSGTRLSGSDGRPVDAYWQSSGNRIVLKEDNQLYGDLVRHEMLHALLRRTGHPRDAFVGRCAGVVVCTSRCLAEGGPPAAPDPSALPVAPTEIQVAVEIDPAAPSPAFEDGHFRMIVSARNPRTSPVVAQLPPSGDAGPPGSFGYRIFRGDDSGYHWYDMRADAVEVTRFAAGETKRFVFDMRIGENGTRYDLAPGTWRFEGTYGGAWDPSPPTVTLAAP